MDRAKEHSDRDWATRLIGRMLDNPLPAILMFIAVAGGVIALLLTPREEEPQIVVPLADVVIHAPGLSAHQVERQVATPLEKLLFQIDGVEYVYSMSRAGYAVVTVRFYVGEDREDSLVKIYNQVNSNLDKVPDAVTSWVVKPIEIDDVPIVLAALWSEDPERIGDHELRRLAEEIELRLQSIENTNRVEVTGGQPRQIRVELDPEALAARRTTPLDVAWAIDVSNTLEQAGAIQREDEVWLVEAGRFITNARELERLVINVVDGVPVYLRDVARVRDGPAEPDTYTWIGFGPADADFVQTRDTFPAVVVSVAKKRGTNAVWVARDVEERLAQLKDELFPPGVHYRIIRDYGDTANQKVNDLVASLAIAILAVIIFIAIFIGWRAALIVALAVPVTYGVTLLLDLLFGYTINRVTLFALILALGLLVDDPITGVDNIERYFRMGLHKARQSVAVAMSEIRNALIMSTVAIIIAFTPMLFITGMMGPYMAPMAFNVPVTVIASTFVAFLVTPWLAYRLLPHKPPAGEAYDISKSPVYRFYGACIRPLIASRTRAWTFLAIIALLFIIAATLPALRMVPLKLLPYDNKDEFQIVIDMPEGTTLERTESVTRALAEYLRSVPEVRDFTAFVGTPSPMDFNGMIRHYYLRDNPHQADVRVTLAPRQQRAQQSHEILLRIRRDIETIAREHNAPVKLVEVPPGPPVVSTVTAEIYGDLTTPYIRLQESALTLADRLRQEPLVVDVDTSVEADQRKLVFVTDKEKAALSGIATDDIARTVTLATGGLVAGHLQIPTEANPLPIKLRLPIERRSSAADLAALYVKGREGITMIREKDGMRAAPRPIVQIGELGHFEHVLEDKTIYHKNLERVAYVFAEVAGRTPADVIIDIQSDLDLAQTDAITATDEPRPLAGRTYFNSGGGIPWTLPDDVRAVWTGEGEWHITLRVFRDLGIAFAVAIIGIFLVLSVQTRLPAVSGIILLSIPLTVIGIMPGFWLLNQIGERSIAGYPNLVMFTATAMIGMIALAGIVIRNALILIEFIHMALREGKSLNEALIRCGAVRMRPILLTACTTLIGNLVITLDPVFSGLAWAIIFGILASTVFTLAVIPVVYYLVYANRPGHGVPEPAGETA